MRCPKCDLEMLLYKTGPEGDEYVCRNPRCSEYDKRLERKAEPEEKPTA